MDKLLFILGLVALYCCVMIGVAHCAVPPDTCRAAYKAAAKTANGMSEAQLTAWLMAVQDQRLRECREGIRYLDSLENELLKRKK